jgi:tRNA-Thr(GGU) m(6)t(6)A37 methyltransferase TsaA
MRRGGVNPGPSHYEIRPIGLVERGDEGGSRLRVLEPYRACLVGLDGFGHAQVLWWFSECGDERSRATTTVDPPFDAPTLGVFASRAPTRPNPIALSTVAIRGVDVDRGVLEIGAIDAADGSPLIDIKPYLPHYGRVRAPIVPTWAADWPDWMPDDGVELDAPPTFQMRRCTARDAPSLTRLAHASKASWGYPDELLALWDADLTLDPAFVERHDVWAAVAGDEVVGFCAVTGDGSAREIEHLWVAPVWMGRGVGRRLVEHLVARARAAGVEELRVVSDPNAVGFYLRMGARQVGEQASVPAGRRLPVLAIRVSGDATR